MDVYDAIRGRSTAGDLTPEVPPREAIARLIDAAIWAPNHHLTEPWRFTVLAGAERETFGRALADWLQGGGDGETPGEDDVRRARRSMMGAPVTVVVTQAAGADDDPVRELEDYAACCCAVQNLMLAAQADGLASKWMTGRISRYAGAKQILRLDPRDRIVGFVCIGYAAPGAEVAERQRLPARVTWRGW